MRANVRTSILQSVLLAGAVGAGALAASQQVGCSSGPNGAEPEAAGGGSSAENTGSVGMQLTLPGGEQINTVTWTVTGPNGASTVVQSGIVNVANSTTIQFLI